MKPRTVSVVARPDTFRRKRRQRGGVRSHWVLSCGNAFFTALMATLAVTLLALAVAPPAWPGAQWKTHSRTKGRRPTTRRPVDASSA